MGTRMNMIFRKTEIKMDEFDSVRAEIARVTALVSAPQLPAEIADHDKNWLSLRAAQAEVGERLKVLMKKDYDAGRGVPSSETRFAQAEADKIKEKIEEARAIRLAEI